MLVSKLQADTCGMIFILDTQLKLYVFTRISFSRGTFRMEREDGYTFDCRIPPFSLESKQEDNNNPPPESV